ncbi:MAG TPA: hypothetical protein VJ901_10790 [Thermoanaerobaculia bacterium]|jgi:hypothetical protein|nr:hypothetical protein [Thermoanaerobaculia bacterium]
MFRRLAPQKVQHSSGYVVQTGDRYSLQYLEGDLCATIEVDFGVITGIYPDSMSIRHGSQGEVRRPTGIERQEIMDRIKGALDFMGTKYEICHR